MSGVKFMVMKLCTEFETFGFPAQIRGCAGVVPVFDTEAEAKEAADGKFQIIAVQIPQPEATP